MTRMNGNPRGDRPAGYRWVIASIACSFHLAAWGTTQGSFGVFVNPLTEEMGASRSAVSAAISFLIITGFICGLVWGRLSDRWNIRVVSFTTGILIGAGFLLGAYANSIWQFYLFFSVISGAGLGGISGPMVGITSRWFEQNRRGLAIGIAFAGTAVGTAVLPILAQKLISISDWRLGLQALGLAAWAIILPGSLLLRKPPVLPPEQTRQPDSKISEPFSAAIRTRNFWLLFGMQMTPILILFEVMIHLPSLAIDAGVAPSAAATLLTTMGILCIGGSCLAGALGDAMGPRPVYVGAMLLNSAALLWLTVSSSLWMFYIFAAAAGLAWGGWNAQIAATAARIFGPQHMGAIYSGLLIGAGIGATIGPIFAGYIFDVTESYTIAFTIGAGLAVFGATLAIMLRESKTYKELN